MSNVTSCSAWQLYVIVDPDASRGRDPAWIAERAIRGGADVIQLRDKSASTRQLIEEAKRMLQITRPTGVPLLINDRADVALTVQADGVHVGQDDLPISAVRAVMGPHQIIGTSTHSLAQALEADREPVDYLALGPIFATPTKPGSPSVGFGLIAQVKARVKTPLVVIGGIDLVTLPQALQAGDECVAVVRAVCAADDPERAAKQLKQVIRQSPRTT